MESSRSAATGSFADRQIGPDLSETKVMLSALGFASLDEVTDAAIPDEVRATTPVDLPEPLDEAGVGVRLRELAARNHPGRAMIGQGYYGTVTPAVLRRTILGDPGWYTAYTPYQPEISQGRLEALLVFQTVVAELTGLDTAGASLLDEATAVAEAVTMAKRCAPRAAGARVLVDEGLFANSLAVLRTRARHLGIDVVTCDAAALTDDDLAGAFVVVVQTPASDGRLAGTAELEAIAARAHGAGTLVVAATDLLALTLATPPGHWGADIAVGSAQRFGVPLFYGGPHAGFIACRERMVRQLPGRIVGVSKDADDRPALRLALQTREQHIRRERATSNICTAQALVAVMAAMYAVWHGPAGLRRIAKTLHDEAEHLAGALAAAGFTLAHDSFFDTLTVSAPGRAEQIWRVAHDAGVQLRLVDADTLGISIGEDATPADLAAVAAAFGADLHGAQPWGGMAATVRTDWFLDQLGVAACHSETQMMRYLHTLARRDFALDQGMIPLGSCTMKLTGAVLMDAVTLPGFADLHPLVPKQDAAGYTELIGELERWLCAITGYDAVSFQPNAGSQGELAGLLAVRAYHEHRGEDRDVCLIPASAHGTNAASAAMAGLRVVSVAVADDGSIDLGDLAAKLDQHAGRVAVVMVTYPSTHGVFEHTMAQVAALAHAGGAQVYVDGANLNALAGLAKPAEFGADCGHLNLHKTFAMPHGGGGPGVGPIGVRAHLAPYLPATSADGDMVAGAAYGSAGLLPVSYAYIALMGADGLRRASESAVLAANYIAHRLGDAFPVLYTGPGGLVAHECLLDVASVVEPVGLSVNDVAKRLIDYGFHAPTMSFPVPGTLMVEPTESEDLGELDRFCQAMRAIRAEIDQVGAGVWPVDDNPLVCAPHPLSRLAGDDWTHPYSRTLAGFPYEDDAAIALGRHADKYWPACARIDEAFGDRNLRTTL